MVLKLDGGIEEGDNVVVASSRDEIIAIHEVLGKNPLRTRPRRIL
jgi:predicted ribosome-associated RNA-binding protein Tma20